MVGSHAVDTWNWTITSISYQTFIPLFNLHISTAKSFSWTFNYAFPMITLALPSTIRTLTHLATFIINLHTLSTQRKVSPAVNVCDFRRLCFDDYVFLERGKEMSPFLSNLGTVCAGSPSTIKTLPRKSKAGFPWFLPGTQESEES